MPDPAPSIPRGRHAPPLEVRMQRQRARLFAAAASVFARAGYAEASAEAISREAGMSKATFYEHFANKEECVLGLFDAAAEQVRDAVAASTDSGESPETRVRQGVQAFLTAIVAFPEHSRTLLVEIIGAGPRATERRDRILQDFADLIVRENEIAAGRYGTPRLQSPDDAYALVGAIVELAGRQLRTGRPADPFDLAPVIERLITGVLVASTAPRQ
jgi:AcrR family transcriptional regulator